MFQAARDTLRTHITRARMKKAGLLVVLILLITLLLVSLKEPSHDRQWQSFAALTPDASIGKDGAVNSTTSATGTTQNRDDLRRMD